MENISTLTLFPCTLQLNNISLMEYVITFVIYKNYKCNLVFWFIVITFVTIKCDNMQERFKQLLDEKKMNAARFATIIGVNASAISHILSGRSKPGFEILNKIVQVFPEVNMNWLISGKGAMYNNTINNKNTAIPFPEFEKEPTLFSLPSVSSITEKKKETSNPPLPASKKIKSIILLFDDGSFQIYEHESHEK